MAKKSDVNPRKEPTQERSKATVDAILSAAIQVLSSLGFDSATTNRIAERAGTSVGSIYQYFPNKESLASALVDRYVHKHAGKFEELLVANRDRPVSEMIQEVTLEISRLYLDNKTFLRVLSQVIPRLDRIPAILEARRTIVGRLAGELRARASELAPGDPEVTAFVVVNSVMGVILTALYEDSPALSSERLSAELARLVAGYLAKDGEAKP
jgi:AcrR family transcriptional regulator